MPTKKILDSWLKAITPHSYSPHELDERLSALGLEVESLENRYEMLEGFVVGEVLSREKHPNADKLSVTTVNYGTAEPVTVVCGAPNVAAGQKIAFAPVGTFIKTAGFSIDKRKIRGIESQGMICSESELGLGSGHDGILVLPADSLVGAPLGSVLGDVIYEIGSSANRGDWFSHLGVAREVAAVAGTPIFLPSTDSLEAAQRTVETIVVSIENPELCPRYVARVVKGVKIQESPQWLRDTLTKVGLRPRNVIVDIAAYVMLECGQPLHAFDYDLLSGKQIVVRTANGGEKFITLDGKEHELPEQALLICDAEEPVAIAGVMGGQNSEINDGTVNVLIESAFFNPSSIRRTARLLGLSTDASYRFERGVDIEQLEYAASRAASMMAELAGGEVLTGQVDIYPMKREELAVELRFSRTTAILGIQISQEQQAEYLRRLGFGIDQADVERVMVAVPSFRMDVDSEIDLIEEIARVHGYDQLPEDMRAPVVASLDADPLLKLIEATRHFFVDNGFTEIVAPHQIDPDSAGRFGDPVQLRNALGRDFSVLRTTPAISMARVLGLNGRHGRTDLQLFEVGKAFHTSKSGKGIIPGIVEVHELSIAMSGVAAPQSWDIRSRVADMQDLRGLLERFLNRIAISEADYRPTEEAAWGIGAPALSIFIEGEELGRIGPLDPWLREHADIGAQPVIALLDMEKLSVYAFRQRQFVAPSRYPIVQRDLSLLVDEMTTNAQLEQAIKGNGGPLLSDVRLFDLYQGKGLEPGKKSLAYSVSFTSHEGTLEDAQIEPAMEQIIEALAKVGAKVRGS